jgi:acetolactate synthase I/II/III large subunit
VKNYQDGGEAILEAFRRLGADYVISSPGSEWAPFWEALARQKRDKLEGPAYIDCGHESIAVNMATAYTKITGRLQVVLLHAGAGIMQGTMAVDAAGAMETPLVVMSGEVLGYGEGDFDPGSQWYRNLSVPGGTQKLIEPAVKWSQQVASIDTLHETIVRAGEMAQRTPKGPTYLCVPMETMLEAWDKPEAPRTVPPAPKLQPISSDIDRIAETIANAACPVISVENIGPEQEGFDALIELAELMAIPVVEGQGAFFGNFPKSHDLYLGQQIEPLLDEMDLALLVESRAPWYPPSNVPQDTRIVSISSNPLKENMVYQTMHAEDYLEGDTATTLRLLSTALRTLSPDAKTIEQRRARWRSAHDEWKARLSAAEETAEQADTITPPLVMKALREVLPPEVCVVDETIVHQTGIREHLMWDDPLTFFRAPSGLGQGLGYALGVKLALPDRPVAVTIGDGSLMYNPLVPTLALADEHDLPLLILVFNNSQYAVMKHFHKRFYPDGVAVGDDDYYGVNIKGPKYEKAAAMVGGYSQRVEDPAELRDALEAAYASVRAGKTAILNLIMPGDGGVR